MSRFKEFTGRLRGMVKRSPGEPAPAAGPFNWEAPLEGSEEPRDPVAGLAVDTLPLRPAPSRPPAAPRARADDARSSPEARPPQEPRSPHWRAKSDADFRSIYAEAGVNAPAHGYGVEKVSAMLANSRLASSPRDVRATAALAALEAAQVPLRDLIDDAVLRHKALAAFEAAKALELQATRTRSRSRIEALQEQVRVFLAARNGEIETLNRAVQAARQQLVQLQARKQREEDRLLRVVTHFVAPRPTPAPPPPAVPRGAIVAPALPADPALKPPAPAEAGRPGAAPSIVGALGPGAPPKPGSS
ncbi:MAG: hypothetical protein DMF83_16985 [Acidobacteria bacterium]|nr:MAG: hypothetical protein DMF83_16985 [Acidobacteriota bacterium]